MFYRLFGMMTASVLLCVCIAAFSLLLFFVNMWRSDRLAQLSGDALSLAEGVSSLYAAQSRTADDAANEYLLFAGSAMRAYAEHADADIFFVSPAGEVLLCSDYAPADGDGDPGAPVPCERCRALRFDAALLEKAAQTPVGEAFVCEEPVRFAPDDADERYYLAAAPLYYHEELICFVITAQPVSAAYLPYSAQTFRMLLFTGLIAVLISFMISVAVSLWMLKPLRKITAAMKQYAGGEFSDHIAAEDTYKELTELVDSFNAMAESLAAMDASRSAFVANVSHELKTPITIISGFIDGILDQTIPTEEAPKYLEIVSDETKRLSRLVVAMLNMSRIEAGKLALALADINLRDLVCRTLFSFEKAVSGKRIEMRGIDTLEDVTVFVDEALFSQVIYNLMDNAVKFTPEGGAITVSLTVEKKSALLAIRNTGKGIPPEECALVFDRFYKVDKSRGLDAKSFGMGLYIVKNIVELHQGAITVKSEPDTYTEFQIRLPTDLKMKMKRI